MWNFALAGFLVWVDRKFRLAPGRLMAVYLMGYGTGRFWIEGLRIDPADEIAGLRFNQWVSLVAVVAGALWLFFTRGQKWPETPPVDDVDEGDEDDHLDDDPERADGIESVDETDDAPDAAADGAALDVDD